MPPLTARAFANVWNRTTSQEQLYRLQHYGYGPETMTRRNLEDALEEIRRIRQEGYYPDPRTNEVEHFDFNYGTTKHKKGGR